MFQFSVRPDVCPVCNQPSREEFSPYCSLTCRENDPSHRWFQDKRDELVSTDDDAEMLPWPETSDSFLDHSDKNNAEQEADSTDVFRNIITRQKP